MRVLCLVMLSGLMPLWGQGPVVSPSGAQWGLSAASVWLTGRAYTQTFTYTGGTQCGPMLADLSSMPATFTWTASGSSGVLSGTFTAAGKYAIGISVTCGNGLTRGTYNVTVAGPMTMFAGGFLPPCNAGVGCMTNLTQGGVPPFTARVSSGSLPAGCELAASRIGDSAWGVRLPCLAAVPGTYSFQISVTDGMQETASQSYVLAVGPPAAFYASSNTMLFRVTAGGAVQTQPLGVGTNDLSVVKFTASSDSAWLSALASTSSLTVQVNPATLRAGAYTGRLTVKPEGARPSVVVTVTAVVGDPAAMLELAPDSVTLDVAPGKDAARTYSIAFQTWNSGSLGLTAQVSAINPPNARTWLTTQPAQVSLAPGEVKTLTVNIDATVLLPGTYQGWVLVRTGTQSKMVPVTVTIPPEVHVPILRINRSAWHTTKTKYHADESFRPDNSFVNVSNDDWSTTLDFTATLEGLNGAAEVRPSSGRVSGSSWAELNIFVDHSRITGGRWSGLLTVTAPGARNSPAYARIEYEITAEGQILGSATPVEIEASTPIQVTGEGAEPLTSELKIVNSSNVPISFTLASPSSMVSIPHPNGVAAAGSVTTSTYNVDASKHMTTAEWYKIEAHIWSIVGNTTSIHWEGMSITRTNVATSPMRMRGTNAAACTATKLVVAPNAPLTFFRQRVDWPVEIKAVVYDDCGNPAADATVSAAFSNGDPSKLLALADGAKGQYSGSWTPGTAGEAMSITLRALKGSLAASYQMFGTVTEDATSPIIFNGGVVNNVNPVLGAPVAPGSVVAIYGKNLAAAVTQAQSVPLPRQLGGTTVLIGGVQAPLFFVSPGQINAQVPFELPADAPHNIVVRNGEQFATPKPLRLAKLAPGIAAYADGKAVAQHLDYSLVNAAAPAKAGEYLILYLVGMGPVSTPVATGTASPAEPLARVTSQPAVTIGGLAAEVVFAGLTPGGVGLYQIAVRVPEAAPAGDLALVLTQEGVVANTVTLPVVR